MIVVIDSGTANITSVMAALNRLNVEAHVTSRADQIEKAEKVILPGVGSANAAMANLRSKGLVNVLQNVTQPLLGICLGMQILFSSSEEGQGPNGAMECLGIVPGQVKRFHESSTFPVPHMGWNTLKSCHTNALLLKNIPTDSHVYYVHSYFVPLTPYTEATTDYSQPFSAVIACRNFYGCQFHPERSGSVGGQILQNFLEL